MASHSGARASDQAQTDNRVRDVRYDEDGRAMPEPTPKRATLTLPGSIVEYWGDDPGDWSGLRDELDTPEARMQDPAVQARLLHDYQAAADRRGFAIDWDSAERYWFGDTRPGTSTSDLTERTY